VKKKQRLHGPSVSYVHFWCSTIEFFFKSLCMLHIFLFQVWINKYAFIENCTYFDLHECVEEFFFFLHGARFIFYITWIHFVSLLRILYSCVRIYIYIYKYIYGKIGVKESTREFVVIFVLHDIPLHFYNSLFTPRNICGCVTATFVRILCL